MSALHYTHAGGSGAARYVANLSRALVAEGIEVDLLCPRDFAYAAELSAQGVRILRAPPSLAEAQGRAAKLAAAVRQSVIGAWLAGRRPNPSHLVHMNFVGIPILAVPLVAWLRLRGRRVILTVHDVWPHRPLLDSRLSRFERLPLGLLYRMAEHIVVHYPSAVQELSRAFGVPASRVTVIPHGADVALDGSPTRRPDDPVVRLAVLGSIRRNKGVHLAIGAVQDLRRRGLPVELVIAGRPGVAEAGYWRMCRSLIERAPGGIDVTSAFVSDDEMRSILLGSDAVLLPYVAFEAQSGVAIEAISSGRAILATGAGGLDELLERSGAGIRIETASPEGVRAAIEQALDLGRPGLAALGGAGVAYAREQLDWRRVAARHIALYRQLVAEPGRGGRRIADRLLLVRGWAAILVGRSYRHRPQDVGRAFRPDRLDGYFVDLTAKTEYNGPFDPAGLPLTRALGRLVHHPTVVLQFGLGHWDRSLDEGPRAAEHRGRFIDVATWTVAEMDERGGLAVFPQLGLETITPYSAMTQGLAVSVLSRASHVDVSTDWLAPARRAARLMLEPIEIGGTSRRIAAGTVLVEAPLDPPNTVLNGWLFGLFGLHDLLLADNPDDPALAAAVSAVLAALLDCLPAFDAGWWSRYDIAGHLASPFYQRLHVAQLTALERAYPAKAERVSEVRSRWERALRSPLRRTRAVVEKAGQQLLAPPPMIR